MPPAKLVSPATAYERALEEARARAFTIRSAHYQRLLRAFAESLTRLAALETSSSPLTAARASSLREQIQGILTELNSRTASLVAGSVELTVQDLVEIHAKVNRQILAQHAPGLAIRTTFNHVPVRVLAAIASRNGNAAHFRSLLNHRFSATIEQVDALIDSAVARGVASGTLTKDLALMMSDNSLAGKIPSGSRLQRGDLGNIDWSRYDIDPSQIKQARKILYDSRRIAVSESANAMREANAHSLTASPLAQAAVWQMNSRHEKVDECDVLANGTFYENLGRGVYPVEYWPRAPHPHCGCYQGKVVLNPVKEWGDPKQRKWKQHEHPYIPKHITDQIRPRNVERAREVLNVNPIRITKAGTKVKPPPKPKAPPKNPRAVKMKLPPKAPKLGAAPMKLTNAQVDEAIDGVLKKSRQDIPTAASLADEIGKAMDAPALGIDMATQKPIFRPKFDLYDKRSRPGVLGTAYWDGYIGLDKTTSDGLAKLRAEWYLGGKDPSSLSYEAISAFKTLVHEVEHMRSPTRYTGKYADAISYGRTSGSRYIEEGIVERKAGNRVARAFFDADHFDSIPLDRMQRSYPEYTMGMDWYAKMFGEDALEHVWAGVNGEERVKRVAQKLRPMLEMRARKITHPVLRETVKTRLSSLSDDQLVTGLHRLAKWWKVGEDIGDQLLNNAVKLMTKES